METSFGFIFCILGLYGKLGFGHFAEFSKLRFVIFQLMWFVFGMGLPFLVERSFCQCVGICMF